MNAKVGPHCLSQSSIIQSVRSNRLFKLRVISRSQILVAQSVTSGADARNIPSRFSLPPISSQLWMAQGVGDILNWLRIVSFVAMVHFYKYLLFFELRCFEGGMQGLTFLIVSLQKVHENPNLRRIWLPDNLLLSSKYPSQLLM